MNALSQDELNGHKTFLVRITVYVTKKKLHKIPLYSTVYVKKSVCKIAIKLRHFKSKKF